MEKQNKAVGSILLTGGRGLLLPNPAHTVITVNIMHSCTVVPKLLSVKTQTRTKEKADLHFYKMSLFKGLNPDDQ